MSSKDVQLNKMIVLVFGLSIRTELSPLAFSLTEASFKG